MSGMFSFIQATYSVKGDCQFHLVHGGVEEVEICLIFYSTSIQ